MHFIKRPSNVVVLLGSILLLSSFIYLFYMISVHHVVPPHLDLLLILGSLLIFVLMPSLRVVEPIIYTKNYMEIVDGADRWYQKTLPALIVATTVLSTLLSFDTALFIQDLMKIAEACLIALCMAVLSKVLVPRIRISIESEQYDQASRYLALLVIPSSMLTSIWIMFILLPR